MKISYFIKPNGKTVMARVRIDGNHFDISTKIKTIDYPFNSVGFFDAKNKEARVINKKISEWQGSLEDKHESYKKFRGGTSTGFRDILKEKKTFTTMDNSGINFKFILEEFKRRLEEGRVENRGNGKPIALGTYSTWKGNCSTLLRVLSHTNDINIAHYNFMNSDIVSEQEINKAWTDFFTDLKIALRTEKNSSGKKFTDGTISNYCAFMRNVSNQIAEEYGLEIRRYMERLKYTSKESEVETMTKDQTNFILNNYDQIREDCGDSCKGRAWKNILDYWVAGLVVGARVSDMGNWTGANIIKKDGRTWLKFKPVKTINSSSVQVNAPVPEILEKIFERNMVEFGNPLPKRKTTSYINDIMREMAKQYDVFKTPMSRIRQRGGETDIVEGISADFLTIHKTRSTAITNMLSKGIPPHVVMEISGHKKGSKSFYEKYVKVFDDDKVSYFDNYFSQIVA